MAIMRTALVAASMVLLGGCTFNVENKGPIEHFQKSIDLDKSEMARVEIKMGAGELKVGGGSSKLMEADFEYNIPSWKPVVRYNASSFRGELLIEQPGSSNGANNVDYKWELRLNDKLPLDIVTHLGAGEAHMNLGGVNLRSLEVHMGVGEVELDLRGKPTRDYNVEMHGGIGQAIVHLPAGVGIVATAAGGIGNIDVRGLEKRNGRWINASHENSPVTIHLDVKGGIGNITLAVE
jgi:N-terminal domain of toast_rack, DUF2154